MLNFNFSGKNVLITGGSRGIGRACARLFAAAGATVIITYKQNIHEAKHTLTFLGDTGKHAMYQLDITNAQDIEFFFNRLIADHQRLDILINNAGVYVSHVVEDVSFEQWRSAWTQTIDTNLVGVSNLCYFAARQMILQQYGKIVNISSRGAFRGEPNHIAYAASKAGLNAMSQSLALALGKHNITVGVVAPGFVETEMAAEYLLGEAGEKVRQQSPLNRVATAEEVARLVAVHASDNTAFMTGGISDLNGASYLRS